MLLEPVGCGFVSEVAKAESGPAPYFDRQGFFFFPAKHSGWYSMGTKPFAICVPGGDDRDVVQLDPGDRYGSGFFGREGTSAGNGFLAPGFPIGAFLAKFGNGAPSMIMRDVNGCGVVDGGDEEVYLGINDSNYSDNNWEFKFIVRTDKTQSIPIPESSGCPTRVVKQDDRHAYIQTMEDNLETGITAASFSPPSFRLDNEYGLESKGLALNRKYREPRYAGGDVEYQLVIKNPTRQCLRLKVTVIPGGPSF